MTHQSDLPSSCLTLLRDKLIPSADTFDTFVFYLSCCAVPVIAVTFFLIAVPTRFNPYYSGSQFNLKLHDDPHYFIAWLALTVTIFSVHIPLILLTPSTTPAVNRSAALCYITGFSFPFTTIAGGCWVLALIHYMYAKGRDPMYKVSQMYIVWVVVVSAVTSVIFAEMAWTAPAHTEYIKEIGTYSLFTNCSLFTHYSLAHCSLANHSLLVTGAPICRFTCRGPGILNESISPDHIAF